MISFNQASFHSLVGFAGGSSRSSGLAKTWSISSPRPRNLRENRSSSGMPLVLIAVAIVWAVGIPRAAQRAEK